MVILRTLGECVIEIGTQRIGPTAPHLFGALLYLGLERGRAVPRATLQTLLFPDTTEARGAHSLRQLVYKLRGHGAPVATGREGISLAASDVQDDFTAFLAPSTAERPDVHRAGGTFLPGYVPRWSRPFAEWVEGERDRVHARMRRTLLTELAEHRRLGRWEAAERTARACLAIDPLNEEATLALAEALAVAGSKVKAVRLLDDYIAEAGPGAEAIKLPATLLRRRIAERLPAMEYDASRAPFVGRAEEMAELNALFAEVRRETSRTAVVWGDAGIGKTRLVAEFCKAAALNGATVLRAVSQPHDVRRPMGAFLDLAPQLLKLPGALGTSPDAMRYLQRLVTFDPQLDQPITAEMRDPEYLAACITRALSELLDAVTSEAPLIVVIEDAQWLDRVSTLVLGDLLAERRERRLLLVGTWRAPEDPMPGLPFPERSRSIRLGGLRTTDAETLLLAQFRELAVSPGPELMAWAIRTAQGNPFFLHELARHYAVSREAGTIPASLTELLRARLLSLRPDSQRVLAASAILASHSTLERIARVLQLPRRAFHRALEQLETAGLLACQGDTAVVTHPLIGEQVLQRLTPGVSALLHRHAAEELSRDLDIVSPLLPLACADHWVLAGDSSHAIELLRRCSSQTSRLGYHREALTFAIRAFEIAQSEDMRLRIGLDALSLADVAADTTTSRQIAESLLSGSQDLTADTADWLRLQVIRARWQAGEPPIVLHQEVAPLTFSNRIDVRLASIRLALIFCDWDRRRMMAEHLYRSVQPELEAMAPTDRESSQIDLIYHTSFGDPDLAASHARKHWDRVSTQRCSAEYFAAVQNIGVALSRCDYYSEALAILSEANASAVELRLPRHAFNTACQATASALDAGDIGLARQWHARSTENLRTSLRHHAITTHHLNALRLATADRDHRGAIAALNQLTSLANHTPSAAVARISAAMGIAAQISALRSVSVAEVESLRQLAVPSLGDDALDPVISAYTLALRVGGAEEEAKQIELEHLARRRGTRQRLAAIVPDE